ncbi:MAG: T9SS type A sorting domain-containing protein [bacterium]
MKKAAFMFILLVTVFLVVLGDTVQAQTPVSQWGFLGGRQGNWKFTPGSAAGSASIGGTASLSVEWGAIRGGFDAPLTATTATAVVVTGTIEFVGAGINTWSGLRYGLFNHTAAGTLITSNVDSTRWSGSESSCSGYMFSPKSGANNVTDGASGGIGTQWLRISGNYISTSSGSGPIATAGVVNQSPVRAVADAGVYEFAFSVQPLANGTKEVRFYLIKGTAANSAKSTYYFGGSFIDTSSIAPTFNGIVFAVHATGSGPNPDLRGVKLSNVKASLGTPFAIPVAPWSPFYVDNWGASRGNAWKIKNDSTYLVGDAMMSGASKPAGASLSGGFPEAIPIAVGEAIIVSGQLEYVGGGAGPAYTGLRYALTFQDSMKLNNKNRDSALWVTSAPSGATKGSYGYEFTPRSGGTDLANGGGGSGVIWTVINGGWNSTWSNNGGPIFSILQSPRLAEISMGVYDWKISVQRLSDGTNEVRFYIEKQHATNEQTKYWTGGVGIDKAQVSTKFNFINFWINNDIEASTSAFKLMNVKVDKGAPITVTSPPWSAYYIDLWGFIGGRINGWKYTKGEFTGNATISGTRPNDRWSAIRGGFDPVTPTTTKALYLTGKVEFVGGGFEALNSFRYGVFFSDQAGKVDTTSKDSTRWSGLETYHSGYLFIPPSGTNGLASWPGLGKTASSGGVVYGAWLHNDYTAAGTGVLTSNYTLGTGLQSPANAVGKAGVYDYAISVAAKADGSADVRYKFSKADKSYVFEGKLTDTNNPLATKVFNCVAFAVDRNPSTTGLKITDLKVDFVDVATVPLVNDHEVTTAVEEGIVPTEFGIAQNYPNPFNPSTSIQYDVPTNSYVTLTIHDMLGRVIATLVNGAQTPNRYTVQWNASTVSSGVYFYRIDARSEDGKNNFTATKKLLLVK